MLAKSVQQVVEVWRVLVPSCRVRTFPSGDIFATHKRQTDTSATETELKALRTKTSIAACATQIEHLI